MIALFLLSELPSSFPPLYPSNVIRKINLTWKKQKYKEYWMKQNKKLIQDTIESICVDQLLLSLVSALEWGWYMLSDNSSEKSNFFFSASRYQLANSFLIRSWALCLPPLLWAGFCLTWICLGVWTVTISLCWYVYQRSFVEDAIFVVSYSTAGSYNLSAFSSA